MIDGRRSYARRFRGRSARRPGAYDDALRGEELAMVLLGQDERDAELQRGRRRIRFVFTHRAIRQSIHLFLFLSHWLTLYFVYGCKLSTRTVPLLRAML